MTKTTTHPDGRVQPLMRKLPSGSTIPVTTVGRTWHELIAPGRGATGGSSADPKHPSRKHDLTPAQPAFTPATEVQAPVPGQARRRDRRAAARHAKRHYEVAGASGGGEVEESSCFCGASFSAPTRALLIEVTSKHYGPVAA